jgi:hypothetical protein
MDKRKHQARSDVKRLIDIPNIGKAIEKDLKLLGIHQPNELVGKDPYRMHSDLCKITGKRQDPCLLDTFIAAVRYMEGGPAKKWWEYTKERKQTLGQNQ